VAVLTALCVAKGGYLTSGSQVPGLLRTLAGFALGVLLYRAYAGDAAALRTWATILFVPLVCLALATLFAIGALACVVCFSVGDTGPIGTFLNSKPFRALGDWSYGIYLWHAPVHFLVLVACAASGLSITSLGLFNARVLALCTALAVVGVSAVTYKYFEAPMRSWLARAMAGFDADRRVSAYHH
jgi:peptidoglycan/LPS O-acetylase OafA/YrhL